MKIKLIIAIFILVFITSCNQAEVEKNQEIVQTTITEEGKTNLLKDVKNTELRQLFEDYIDFKNGGDIKKEPIAKEKLQELEKIKGDELIKAQEQKNIKLIKMLRSELRIIKIMMR